MRLLTMSALSQEQLLSLVGIVHLGHLQKEPELMDPK